MDENTRAMIIRRLKRIRKFKEEEETLRELLEDVLDRKKQQEDEMWKELEDDMASWDTEKEENEHEKSCNCLTPMGQKAENLENDFQEESSKTRELGWSDEKSNPKCWLEKARDSES